MRTLRFVYNVPMIVSGLAGGIVDDEHGFDRWYKHYDIFQIILELAITSRNFRGVMASRREAKTSQVGPEHQADLPALDKVGLGV